MLFQLTPLIDVLLWNLKPLKFLDLCCDSLGLVLERKPVLSRQFLKFFVKIVFVLGQIGEALFLFFLRLTQIQIALEPGFDEPLILELIDLLGADAFLASIVRRLLVDLLKRRLVFGCNFRLLAREDLAGLGGELCLQRADGRLGLAKFGVIGIEIALRLFEAVILLFALDREPS